MQVLVPAFAILLISVASAEEKIIELFDGKSLAGWETVEGLPVTTGWRVDNGTLLRDSHAGPIYAVGEYGDFELRFDWKIAPGGNSGVKYRVAFYPKGVWGNPAWLGCEYQLWDDEGRSTNPKKSAGALYELYMPNDKKRLRAVGQFNESKIVCSGTKIEHWLNGELIVEADTSSDEWKERIAASKFGRADNFFANPAGRIQLQDHGHNVWFRNITLRVIESK